MSYCRFSSDDCKSDVYVYSDIGGGWTTHVADRRYKPGAHKSLPEDFSKLVEWAAENMVAIELPHAGESFNHDTPQECADNLERLRDLGYMVPSHAIEALRGEVVEDD